MKRSNDFPEMLDLERDLPTTAQDVDALRRLMGFPRLTLDEYLLFLASLPAPPPEDLLSRRGPRGDRPFRLDSEDGSLYQS